MNSSIQLQSLLNFKLQELIKRDEEFSQVWIKEEKCSCVKFIVEGRTINCKHYQKSFKKEYKKERESLHQLSSLITKIELCNNPQFSQDWLYSLKL